jgi:hypothetical protein
MFEQLYPNLFTFISTLNRMNAHFGDKIIDLREVLNSIQIDELYLRIECKLSPENLHCDSEISRADANRKYEHLIKCAEQLGKLTGVVREVN